MVGGDEQKVVWEIIEGYDRKPPTLATDATVTEIKVHQQNLNWPLEPPRAASLTPEAFRIPQLHMW